MISLALFFFLRMTFAIRELLWFHINFVIICSSLVKSVVGILERDYLESVDCFGKYYTATKKEETMPFEATRIDLEGIMLSGIIKTEKDQYHMIFHL